MTEETQKSYFMEKISNFLKELNEELMEKKAKVGVVIAASEHLNEKQNIVLIGYGGMKGYQQYAVADLLKDQLKDL